MKKLFATLLCLAMLVGVLPTAAMAEEDTRFPEVQFNIVKKVVKADNAATPPAETFVFELEDTANEKKAPAAYGIELLNELKIETDGVNDYVKAIRARIDLSKVNPNGGWDSIIPTGSQTPSSYYKTFHISEKNSGTDGWSYSTAKYAVTFRYDCEARNMTCGVYEIGNDVTFRAAEFKNTYTKQAPAAKTMEVPFTVTVKQGGNVAPGKQTFELEPVGMGNSNANEYADVKVTAFVETNGVGDYEGTLAITGPADQVEQFTCEGFFVREKNTKAANWTYSDALWLVMPEEDGFTFYPGEMKTTDNGDQPVFEETAAAGKMTFINIYTENKTVTPEKTAETKSPKTGDSSNVALWFALLFVSGGAVAATALYSRRKKSAK